MVTNPTESPDIYLQSILERLVGQSFPRLRRVGLTILWGGEEDLLFYSVEGNRHLIRVNERLRRATRHALEGGIVHELCHIDADMRLSRYQRQIAWERYMNSRWCRMREERATELEAVRLGYGNQLLALIRYARGLGWSFSREHGLLYAEIVRAMNAQRHRFRRAAWARDDLAVMASMGK